MLEQMLSDGDSEPLGAAVGLTIGSTAEIPLADFLDAEIGPGEASTTRLIVAIEEDPERPWDQEATPGDEPAVIVSTRVMCRAGTVLDPAVAGLIVNLGSPDRDLTLGSVCDRGAEAEEMGSGSGPRVGFRGPVTLRLPETDASGAVPQPVGPDQIPEGITLLVDAADPTA